MITPTEIKQLLSAPSVPPKPLSDLPRAKYWREYHAHRQATDPAYRARKLAAALIHKAALKNKANHG